MATYSTEKKKFWPWAKVTNTKKRYDPGCKKYRQKFDMMDGFGDFVKLRRYESNGQIKYTVEVEV